MLIRRLIPVSEQDACEESMSASIHRAPSCTCLSCHGMLCTSTKNFVSVIGDSGVDVQWNVWLSRRSAGCHIAWLKRGGWRRVEEGGGGWRREEEEGGGGGRSGLLVHCLKGNLWFESQ